MANTRPIMLCQHCQCRPVTRSGVYTQVGNWSLCGRCCDALRHSVTFLRSGKNAITQIKPDASWN